MLYWALWLVVIGFGSRLLEAPTPPPLTEADLAWRRWDRAQARRWGGRGRGL